LVLDLHVIEELRQLESSGSSWGLDALIDLFHKELKTRHTQLQAALLCQDLAAAQHSAHTLKGGAAGLGARELAALCQQIESRIKERRLDGVKELLDALEQSYQSLAPILNRQKSSPD